MKLAYINPRAHHEKKLLPSSTSCGTYVVAMYIEKQCQKAALTAGDSQRDQAQLLM